jgi:hypothetical protein
MCIKQVVGRMDRQIYASLDPSKQHVEQVRVKCTLWSLHQSLLFKSRRSNKKYFFQHERIPFRNSRHKINKSIGNIFRI